ncbi:hypothetical protein J7315_22395 [Providencia rettgeri]|uniref:hypothetical protein n=1 Tax=Providencia rettgeri TaxID=587 RepID=UPI001B37565C|nr:hypothetical protein [Providencia rettgeri]MBQ0688795.1 hypothetical protein [Providencia rettgeri]
MIKIILNKKRILSSSYNTNEIYSSIVLFIIYHALKGKIKSIDLEYLSFTFDCIIKNTNNIDYDFVSCWDVNPLIKPIILLLSSYQLINIINKNSKLSISITDSGNLYVEEMISEKLFNEVNEKARKITSKLTIKKLKNNKLIW